MPLFNPQGPLGSNPYKFRARRVAAQNTSTGAFTKLLFDTKDFDTSSNFDAVTNNRFTVPFAGFYQFNAYCSAGATPGAMIIALYKNGSVYQRGSRTITGGAWGVMYNDLVQAAVSDFFEVFIFADNTVALDVSANIQPFFSGFLVSTI